MKKILIINGPNLNFLGIRQKDIYGELSYDDLCKSLIEYSIDKVELEIYQSNHEGDIIDKIQEAYFNHIDGIIINPGAYTHTSIAVRDALASVSIPTIEVHLTNIFEREEFRHQDYIYDLCFKHHIGEGINGYFAAILDFINK